MHNRFVYTIGKDQELKFKVIGLVILLGLCVISWVLYHTERIALKDILYRQETAARVVAVKSPAAVKSPQFNDLLSGIVMDGDQSFAIINGKMVRVGDEVGSRKVALILDREVKICEQAVPDKCEQLLLAK